MTIQARSAQLVAQDLLAPTVQQVGKYQICYQGPSSKLRLSNLKKVTCLQACPARVAVQALQVCTAKLPHACHAASCLICGQFQLIWSNLTQLVTLQARLALVAAQDLLAQTVQQVGTGHKVPSSCQSLTNIKMVNCLQACPARAAVLAPQVCDANFPGARHAASCLTCI